MVLTSCNEQAMVKKCDTSPVNDVINDLHGLASILSMAQIICVDIWRKQHRQFKDGERSTQFRPSHSFSAAAGAVSIEASNLMGPLQQPINERDYQRQLIDWAISQDLTFRLVTHAETRSSLAYTEPQLLKIIPNSHSTLADHIRQAYQQRREQLRDILHSAQSNIHISFDICTSTTGLSLVGIVGHFLDAGKQHRTAVLGLPRIPGSHSSGNIANCLARTINDYQLTSNLGLFQMDNASNNNTCMEQLMLLVPEISSQARLRCLGHIINLVVKAIIW